MLLHRCEPDMATPVASEMLITTWENREQILDVMSDVQRAAQQVQDLWKASGAIGRLTQDDTDTLVGLLFQIGSLNDRLLQLA